MAICFGFHKARAVDAKYFSSVQVAHHSAVRPHKRLHSTLHLSLVHISSGLRICPDRWKDPVLPASRLWCEAMTQMGWTWLQGTSLPLSAATQDDATSQIPTGPADHEEEKVAQRNTNRSVQTSPPRKAGGDQPTSESGQCHSTPGAAGQVPTQLLKTTSTWPWVKILVGLQSGEK